MRYPVTVLLFLPALLTAAALGESRGRAYTTKELAEQSTLVFEGKVLEIETVEKYGCTFPVKAEITNVLKGTVKEKEIPFKHKDPGRCVIFKEEFNEPAVGQEGTFYLQDQGGTLVLIGYIRTTEPKKTGDKQ